MTDNEVKEWASTFHGLVLAKNEATEMYHYIEWYEQGFYASDPLLRVVNIMFLYGERSTLAALNILFETYVIKFETYLALLDKICDKDSFSHRSNVEMLNQVYLKLLEIREKYYQRDKVNFEL